MFKKSILTLFLLTILCIFLIYIYLRNHSIDSNSVEINAELDRNLILVPSGVGVFAGTRHKYKDKEVAVFLSIPYALPPIGSLRFRAPVPSPPIISNQTFLATNWPNPCPQKDNHLRLNNYNFSEDCLYLNIWSPSADIMMSDIRPVVKLKPVVVHIHTGAFMFGSASETTYNGLVLSALGDVVVVTFNYRLNIYGFLYAGTGGQVWPNAGMYDQVMALKWVSANIGYFGGDSNRVTLLGQSTGALSVGSHILSPISNTLFNSAVMLSGSPLQYQWLSEPERAKQFWIKYLKEVKCMADIEVVVNDKVLECLTQLSRDRLPAMTDAKRYSEDPFVVLAPVVFDNEFKQKNSIQMSNSRNMSLLFGYTEDEGSWMLAMESVDKFGPKVKQNMTFNEALNELKRIIKLIKSNTNHEINVNSIAEYYFNSIPNDMRNDKNLLSHTIGIALGDFYISCPLHHFADHLFRSNDNLKVYQYYWTYKGDPKSSSFWRTFEDVWCGEWMGSCHSFELYAIFGIPFQQSIAFNDIDRRISLKMIKTISYFAYYNKPMPQESKEWLEFKKSINIDPNITKPYHTIDYRSNGIFGKNIKTYECDSLWKPSLIN